eukprot:gnl/TRDRNA2_/TRDRNA2_158560_c0_seq1.p1 gnl/TRDRNA2_/TRDRNA2_158560_c0~~gnl/TRDRNA2_/TRDRNA2_158560_c0_seq1.p1  ORF type:complete len:417 (+),score=67.40 gnl/TRDRNA2_/TRDRNA2_158560_c0_seq1:70-1320(+)
MWARLLATLLSFVLVSLGADAQARDLVTFCNLVQMYAFADTDCICDGLVGMFDGRARENYEQCIGMQAWTTAGCSSINETATTAQNVPNMSTVCARFHDWRGYKSCTSASGLGTCGSKNCLGNKIRDILQCTEEKEAENPVALRLKQQAKLEEESARSDLERAQDAAFDADDAVLRVEQLVGLVIVMVALVLLAMYARWPDDSLAFGRKPLLCEQQKQDVEAPQDPVATFNPRMNVYDVAKDDATVRYIEVECPGVSQDGVQWQEVPSGWRLTLEKKGLNEAAWPVHSLQRSCGTWTKDFVYTDGLYELHEDEIMLENGLLTIPLRKKERPRVGRLSTTVSEASSPPCTPISSPLLGTSASPHRMHVVPQHFHLVAAEDGGSNCSDWVLSTPYEDSTPGASNTCPVVLETPRQQGC